MFEKLDTEKPNPDTVNLDSMNVYQILEVMNAEDSKVPQAVAHCITEIGKTVEFCIRAVKKFARVVYVG
ncbi:MAG: N-acetylmuramic acid 6-phosphate etherase, partial [Petrotogaceae bacterium]|nr:N-acetylmuramic acid 6-phosphate etherase [Petrotogaceae bacterium]